MTDQTSAAAERSAHVSRGPDPGQTISPVVEIAPGVFRLRAIVEAEAQAWRAGAMAMREAAAAAVLAVTRPEDWMMAPVAARIRSLPLPTPATRGPEDA